MTIENMIQSEIDNLKSGLVYNTTLTLSGVETSKAISIPEVEILGVAVQTASTGVVNIYATAGTPEQITANTNIWELWDGISEFNNSVTAIYADNLSGDSSVFITVRGY